MRITFERNALCPCGSGRKYKRCCQGRIDKACTELRALLGKAPFRSLVRRDLIHVVGAAFALAPEDERAASLEEITPAFERLHQFFQKEDALAVHDWTQRLESLLREDTKLRSLRINPDRIDDFERARELFDEEFGEGAAWALASAAVGTCGSPEDRAVLIWGVVLALEGGNGRLTLGRSIVRISLDEMRQGYEALKAAEDEVKTVGEFWDRLQALRDRFPGMALSLESRTASRAQAALSALMGEQISWNIPVWAMINGLIGSVALIRRASPNGYPVSAGEVRHEQIMTEYVPKDLPVFYPELMDFLESLNTSAARELRDCLILLSDQLADSFIATCYILALFSQVQNGRLHTGLPAGEEFDLTLSDFRSNERLLEYADRLERHGKLEAARHVRASMGVAAP